MLKPIGENIVIKTLKEEKTESGILLTGSNEKSDIATVESVGNNVKEIKAGDKIIYKGNGKEVKIDNEKYIIIKEEDVLAIVE